MFDRGDVNNNIDLSQNISQNISQTLNQNLTVINQHVSKVLNEHINFIDKSITNVINNSVANYLGPVQQNFKEINVQVTNVTNNITNKAEEAGKKIDEVKEKSNWLSKGFAKVKEGITSAFEPDKIIEFGKKLMEAASEFDGFQDSIKASSTSGADATANLSYIGGAIDRLHMPIKEAYENFTDMQQGFVGTGIEGAKLRQVFEGVAETASTLHLSPEKFKGISTALQEIAQSGTLQQDQMDNLAKSLPGAANLAAKAMGMTTTEFQDAVAKSKIKAEDLLPKLGNAMHEAAKPKMEGGEPSLEDAQTDADNSISKLMADMGQKLEPVFIAILSGTAKVVNAVRAMWDGFASSGIVTAGLSLVSGTIDLISSALEGLIGWYSGGSVSATYFKDAVISIGAVLAIYYAYLGALYLIQNATKVTTFLTKMWDLAMSANPIFIIIIGIGALIAILAVLWDKFEGFREFVGGTWGVIKQIVTGVVDLLTNIGQIIIDINTGQIFKVLDDAKKIKSDFVDDFIKGVPDAMHKAAKAAGESKFRFSNIIDGGAPDKPKNDKNAADKLYADILKKTKANGQDNGAFNGAGTTTNFGKPTLKDDALKTSSMGSPGGGGTSAARVVNIHFHAPFQQNKVVSDGDWKAKSRDAGEAILRVLANTAYSEGDAH